MQTGQVAPVAVTGRGEARTFEVTLAELFVESLSFVPLRYDVRWTGVARSRGG